MPEVAVETLPICFRDCGDVSACSRLVPEAEFCRGPPTSGRLTRSHHGPRQQGIDTTLDRRVVFIEISVLIYRPRTCRHAADKPTVRNSDQIEVVMSLVDTAPSSAGKRYPQHARSDCNRSARWE